MTAPVLISRFLLRAPRLPAAALGEAPERLLADDPALAAALRAASPELAAAGTHADARAARRRYLRRAAFRPTPQGAWAGVCVGELGARTAVATGEVREHARPSWAALARLGRELLDEPVVRHQHVRLRRAPSLLLHGARAMWMAPGEPAAAAHQLELDELLDRVLDAATGWVPWDMVARQCGDDDEGDVDGFLLELIDDGLLHHDLLPPLVGPPPDVWMAERLARLPPKLVQGRLAALARDHVVLVHQPARPPTLARAVVERAAALAPVLFRLQDALVPPAAERALDPRLGDALSAVTGPFGEGSLALGPLALGDYGRAPGGDGDVEPASAAPPAALVTLLVDRLIGALAGDGVARFTAAELDAVLPPLDPPPTYELVLAPHGGGPGGSADGGVARARSHPGEDRGWLLGLHAPAGASWGRFAEALGQPLTAALAELYRAERAARPGEATVDVAFAPSPALADLACHPPLREAVLALSSWPEADELSPGALELIADPSALAPLALRAGDRPVAPSPLQRIRSPLAPAGVYQLLAGWSLWRQHAPWALSLGPLAGLARLPRVELDGFVIMPASWRAPTGATPAALQAAGVPRHVQLGHEDELLPVDLDADWAADELRRAAPERVWEIWPPLGDECDAAGRRVEAIVAVVTPGDAHDVAAHAATAAAGRVPIPGEPAAGWRTFKLYGAADRADVVLIDAVAPAIVGALDAGEIDRWFFLRFVEDGRDQLRVRVHAASDAKLARFEARLRKALAPARAAGDVVHVDAGDYHPERARYGEALAMVESIFELDSLLALAALAPPDDAEETSLEELVVLAMDALAAGLGLDARARTALAARLRDAHAIPRGPDNPYAEQFRLVQRRLTAALSKPPAWLAKPLATHRSALSRLRFASSEKERLLPALLHLTANRLGPPAPDLEAVSCYLWERALISVTARKK